MKNLLLLFALFAITVSAKSQEQKVEIVSWNEITAEWPKVGSPGQFICSVIGIPILMKSLEFNNHQDFYSHLLRFPGVTISSNHFLNQAPIIRMRGDANTIVIVDGIRYDASILNTLNPADIESVKVSNSPLAQNYFLNN